MNKLDDFFNKRLSDYSVGDDEWNIPDDAIWERASEYFPKKKKRKFLFVWIFFGFGIGLGLLGSYYNFKSSDSKFAHHSKNERAKKEKVMDTTKVADMRTAIKI